MNCPKCQGLALASKKGMQCVKCDHDFDPFYPWSKIAPTTGGLYWVWTSQAIAVTLNPYSDMWWHGEKRFYPTESTLYGPRILEPRDP